MQISPWFIYFVGISDNVCKLLVVAVFTAVLALWIGGWTRWSLT